MSVVFRVLVASGLALSWGCTSGSALDSPGPRFGHETVYDEAREVTVLFGGFGPDGRPRGDTWGWDGDAWRRLATRGPSPRRWPAAAVQEQQPAGYDLVKLHEVYEYDDHSS